jgi:uncharacterized protein (DUF697 family)
MLERAKRLFSKTARQAQLQEQLERLRRQTPVPIFWLFGKTQSGKTSLIKYLTGAGDAEIGHGFRPCTRFSREYQFPTPEAPLLTFLDTRGLDEPGYDPGEDLDRFHDKAHVIVATVKALDHAQEHVLRSLRQIHRACPDRPIVLALTCLHEAYPQQQHPQPYPFQPHRTGGGNGEQARPQGGSPALTIAPVPPLLEPLLQSLVEQQRRFADVADVVVPIDLTRPEEGFHDPDYGGEQLKHVILEVLPAAYRQTLLTLDEANRGLQDLFTQHTLPHIIGYSSLAASAGALPIPWIDLFVLPAIQTRMVYHLAQLYGQPLRARRFLELASTLGLGIMFRQAVREVAKFIPYVGSVAGGIVAGASTFALGKAFCFYYSAVQQGHVPQPEELRHYYREQLAQAERLWTRKSTS